MEDVVMVPRELFDRVCMRIGIMSDSYACDLGLELEKCLPALEVEEVKEPQERSIRFVDPFTFEIDEG